MRMLQILFCGTLAAFLLHAGPTQAAKRDDGTAPRAARASLNPARVVYGMTGCLDVPPCCRGEVRPSGRGGVVAVVNCGR